MIQKEGNILMAVYSRVLGIDLQVVKQIININKTAELFLQQEAALKLTSDIENLEILVRTTLMRDYGDLSRITQRDIDFIYNTYKIEVKPFKEEKVSNYSIIDIVKIFEEERNIKTDLKVSDILVNYEKDLNQINNEINANINRLNRNIKFIEIQNSDNQKKYWTSKKRKHIFYDTNKLMLDGIKLISDLKLTNGLQYSYISIFRESINKFFKSINDNGTIKQYETKVVTLLDDLEDGKKVNNINDRIIEIKKVGKDMVLVNSGKTTFVASVSNAKRSRAKRVARAMSNRKDEHSLSKETRDQKSLSKV